MSEVTLDEWMDGWMDGIVQSIIDSAAVNSGRG
jgi:hypothetical protein